MGKCYDNPKYDKLYSDVQNTWETSNNGEKYIFEHTGKVLTSEEVMASRCSKYEFLNFDKKEMDKQILQEAALKAFPVSMIWDESFQYDYNEEFRKAFIKGIKWNRKQLKNKKL